MIATDGYLEVSDEFVMYFYDVPFVYILNLIIKVGGAFLGFLGFYKYRNVFYNIVMFKYLMKSREIVNVNDIYVK